MTANVTAYDAGGAQIGTTQMVLSRRSKSTKNLYQYSGMAGIQGKRGRVVISESTGAVSGVALRFGGSEFTDIPVNHH